MKFARFIIHMRNYWFLNTLGFSGIENPSKRRTALGGVPGLISDNLSPTQKQAFHEEVVDPDMKASTYGVQDIRGTRTPLPGRRQTSFLSKNVSRSFSWYLFCTFCWPTSTTRCSQYVHAFKILISVVIVSVVWIWRIAHEFPKSATKKTNGHHSHKLIGLASLVVSLALNVNKRSLRIGGVLCVWQFVYLRNLICNNYDRRT